MNNDQALYTDLPTRSYSLRDYVTTADTFRRDLQDPVAFRRFCISGETDDHQAMIDPLINRLDVSHPLKAVRDIDSVIGFCDSIVVTCPIFVYPISPPAESLMKSVHMECPLDNGMSVPYHKIPNLAFGSWGTRNSIHIFFPQLAMDGHVGKGLSDEQRIEFYTKGIRPAVMEILPEGCDDWPPTYDAELFRIEKRSGKMSYGSKSVPDDFISYLVDAIRRNLEDAEVDWANGFFFSHTIRGIKLSTFHSVNAEGAWIALQKLLVDHSLPENVAETGNWTIDIGLEFKSRSHACLQFLTSSHFHLAQEILGISEDAAARLTSLGSARYSRDVVSHLPGVSGCRIEPGRSTRGEHEVVYLQLYTTDKATTYSPEGHNHGKAITMKEALGDVQPPKFIRRLLHSYNDSRSIASSARIEVRVPLEYATVALLDIDIEKVRASLVAFSPNVWWKFREIRLIALGQVLNKQAHAPPRLRVGYDALLLTAAVVWLINSLHSRPDDGSAARSLMRAVLPLTEADEADQTTVLFTQREEDDNGIDVPEDGILPYNPYGLIFLRRLKTDAHAPRLRSGGPWISEAAFKYFFGGTYREVNHKLSKIGITPRGVAPRTRITNKAKITPHFIPNPDSQEHHSPAFALAAQGHSLPEVVVEEGSDVEEDSDREEQRRTGNIDEEVQNIYLQFLADMALKSPIPNGKKAWLRVGREERRQVTEELYMETDLAKVFWEVFVKARDQDAFELAFSHLFPERDHELLASSQTYSACTYYQRWKLLSMDANEQTFLAIRAAIRKRVERLNWIPYACSDRMWPTHADRPKKGWTRFPRGSVGPAPRILVKGRYRWDGTAQ